MVHSVHLRNSNKQQLILTKFYINNASFISSQSAKFQLNPPKQTMAKVTQKHFSFRSSWMTLDTKT